MATATQELLPLGQVKFEMSSTIGNLVDSLAKARKAFKPVIKDATNPFFHSKYADLASVIEATKDGLSDNGLAVLQFPLYNGNGAVQLITVLAHSSGEWLKSILDIPLSKVDAQGIGSGTTYARRYAYAAAVNVASEEDDDANGAVSQPFKRKEESHDEFDQRTEEQQNISVAQVQEIDKALKRTGKKEDEIIAALGFIGEKRIEHIKKGHFQKFLKWANGATKPKSDPTRDAANKKLWALAAEHSIPEEDVKKCAYERYKVQSMTELTTAQLEDMANWVKDVAAAVAES
jgi:hypothetical protein